MSVIRDGKYAEWAARNGVYQSSYKAALEADMYRRLAEAAPVYEADRAERKRNESELVAGVPETVSEVFTGVCLGVLLIGGVGLLVVKVGGHILEIWSRQ